MKSIVLATFMTVFAGMAFAQGVPVIVGHEKDLDACSAVGVVANLKPVAGNFLSFRSGPNASFQELAKLNNGDQFWLCETKGDWLGIVLFEEGVDCGVSSPVDVKGPYVGPCRQGWIFSKYAQLIAG